MRADIFFLLMVFGAAIILQIIVGLIQYHFIHKKVIEIKRRNKMVAVGKSGSRAKNSTAVLAFDAKGYLQEGYVLSGLSVFGRLKRLTGHDGKHFSELEKAYCNNKRMSCVINAIQYVEVL